MLQNYFFYFNNFSFNELVDVLLVSLIVYYIYTWISKTSALPVLQGFLTVIVLTFIAESLNLRTLTFLLESVVSLMLIAVIILFPADIRRIFYRIGRTEFIAELLKLDKKYINTILESVKYMKAKKLGALIAIRRRDSLAHIVNSGVEMRADLNAHLIETIFNKNSLLHDGAMVISKNAIIAVACFIPAISFNTPGTQKYGTRHRAGLSLSENTDAYVIMISEETGGISIANGGTIKKDVSLKKLRAELIKL